MTSITQLPDAVQWWEGMLLSPQHFQQNDIYWQQHLQHRMRCVAPHNWGVRHLRIDHAALANGNVNISELECLLPDGLAIAFPGSYAPQTLELNVKELCKSDGKPIRIWLVVHERGASAAKFEYEERRYDALDGEATADENTGDGEVKVERIRARIELYAADASKAAPSKRVACPLFDVRLDASRQFRVGSYHPPMLKLQSSDFQLEQSLLRQIETLNNKLWSKVNQLAGERGDRNAPEQGGMLESENSEHMRVARHIAAVLPQLDLAINAHHTHPEELYRSLSHVVGQVTALGSNPVPLRMKPYLHDDCMPQFQVAFDYIDAKLELINTEIEYLKFLRFRDGASFAYKLPDTHGDLIVELRTAIGGPSANDLRLWLENASIASEHLMPYVRAQRNGARIRALTSIEIKERKLPGNAHLFLIQNHNINVPGKGALPVFQPDIRLLIEGELNRNKPDDIILYRKKLLPHETAVVTQQSEHEADPEEVTHD